MKLGSSFSAIAAMTLFLPGAVSAQAEVALGLNDFALAAASCIDAVSPDKLDTNKLRAHGWTKTSDERAPFGRTAIFTHPANTFHIYASPDPSGYCMVDGYGLDFSQFEIFQNAVAARLKADYGKNGLTDVAVGKVGSDDRRQGFVIDNAVASYSAAMRSGKLNLRFTTMNVKFAGSTQLFQTSRPPLSDAEIAENRAKDFAALDFAKQPGTTQDLVAMARDCAIALRSDGALQGQGWRKSIHASGSPHAMEALKSAKKPNINDIIAGMAHTRQVLYFVGRHGLVTKYYVRGVTSVCEAAIYANPAMIATIKAEAIAALGLGKDDRPSARANDFSREYLVTDLTRTYHWEKSEVGFHNGFGTSLDGPDSGKISLSIFVF